jgi:hypothetical protein
VAERAAVAALTVERDTLRLAYRNLQHELELMRRRRFVAKAERLDTTQLELEFARKLAALDALSTSSSDSPLRPRRQIQPRRAGRARLAASVSRLGVATYARPTSRRNASS